MQIVNLYRYEESHGVAISPIKRNETDEPHAFRLIAEEGKTLTNDGINFTECIDVASADGWNEVVDTTEATESDYINALSELGVSVNE